MKPHIKPTIANAFTLTDQVVPAVGHNRMRGTVPDESHSQQDAARRSLGTLISPMQADLRSTDYGFSLELSPMQAVDAVHALLSRLPDTAQFLVSMDQSSWVDGQSHARIAVMVERLGIVPMEIFTDDHLVLDAASLAALAAIAQPQRLLIVAIDGPIEECDMHAINRAIDGQRSPLECELRALAAMEVLGDRSMVLHVRDRALAETVVAENFRHYLAAILDLPAESFASPEPSIISGLFSHTGALTVRPIETRIEGSSVDVGVNTSLERFTRPAGSALIYDRPSNSWHTE